MYVLTAAPLAPGIPYEELTYFSKDEVRPGDLVEISIKKRVVRALILHAKPAKEEKQEIRSALFGIKKITKILYRDYIHPTLFQAIELESMYHLQPIGRLIYDLLPEKYFSGRISPLLEQKIKPGFEVNLLQQPLAERIVRYRSIIRESFAKKSSVVIFFPTIHDLINSEKILAKGIEDYVVSFHSGLTEKKWNNSYKEITKNAHPLLILSTPSLLPWLREDLGTIVIEREQSQYYYGHSERYNMKNVLIRLARASRARVILGATLLSLDSYLMHEEREASDAMPIQYRNDLPIEVVPMQDESHTASPYLSKKALNLLHQMHKEKSGHYFFYAHRKGMYPTTVCMDCGTLFICDKCDRPYVLHKIGGVRTYVCHECENIIRIEEENSISCMHCGGWRLTTLGIATTGVEEELKSLGIPTFAIDGERTNTRSKVEKVYNAWRESDYGVLIGTEMAHNIFEEADEIVILSLDSLFSLPEYRTDEKVVYLISEMAEKIKNNGKIILQSRLTKMPVMKHLKSHSFIEFYKDTMKERKEMHLPPYFVVIKAKFHNLDNNYKEKLESEFTEFEPIFFEAGSGKTILFIHVPKKKWEEDREVKEKVRHILSYGDPEVNPLHFFIDSRS